MQLSVLLLPALQLLSASLYASFQAAAARLQQVSEQCQFVLELVADEEYNTIDNFFETQDLDVPQMLKWSCEGGHVKMAKLLLERMSDRIDEDTWANTYGWALPEAVRRKRSPPSLSWEMLEYWTDAEVDDMLEIWGVLVRRSLNRDKAHIAEKFMIEGLQELGKQHENKILDLMMESPDFPAWPNCRSWFNVLRSPDFFRLLRLTAEWKEFGEQVDLLSRPLTESRSLIDSILRHVPNPDSILILLTSRPSVFETFIRNPKSFGLNPAYHPFLREFLETDDHGISAYMKKLCDSFPNSAEITAICMHSPSFPLELTIESAIVSNNETTLKAAIAARKLRAEHMYRVFLAASDDLKAYIDRELGPVDLARIPFSTGRALFHLICIMRSCSTGIHEIIVELFAQSSKMGSMKFLEEVAAITAAFNDEKSSSSDMQVESASSNSGKKRKCPEYSCTDSSSNVQVESQTLSNSKKKRKISENN